VSIVIGNIGVIQFQQGTIPVYTLGTQPIWRTSAYCHMFRPRLAS
jgi:hypothetical protein